MVRKAIHRGFWFVVALFVLVLVFSVLWMSRLETHFLLSRIQIGLYPDPPPPGTPDREHWVTSSGLKRGESLFDISLSEVAARLETLPRVRSVRVHRRWPDQISIGIILHQPEMILAADSLYYVSREGVVYRPLESQDAHDFPLITGLPHGVMKDNPDMARQAVRKALTFYRHLQNNPLTYFAPNNISEIHLRPTIPGEFDLSFFLSDSGVEVRLGAQNYVNLLAKLNRILTQKESLLRESKVFDMRFQQRLIIRPGGKNRKEIGNLQANRGIDLL